MENFLFTKEGKEVNLGEIVFATVFNMLGNIFFSKDFFSLEDEGKASGMKGKVWGMMELAVTPNVGDFFPILARFDLQGLKRESTKIRKDVFGEWETIIKERRERGRGDNVDQQDFLDVLLANNFTDTEINHLIIELFTAGTDASTSTTEWTMAELLKNKDAMNKVCEELRREINQNGIKESNISQLPYLEACVKETLRLHPPAPFLLPRRTTETCDVLNYTVPRNTQVLVNIWAIRRDPTIWKEPLLFNPDQPLGSDLEYKGNNFEFIPFGAGRRICPGLPMASRQVPLILANLIHRFDWSLPNGEDPVKLDMNEKIGITLRKEQPPLLFPRQKL